MEVIVGNYRIRPYRGNTCWQIDKGYKNKDGSVQYAPIEKYPCSISQACKIVFELNLRDSVSSKDSFEGVLEEINKQIDDINAQLDKINDAANAFYAEKYKTRIVDKNSPKSK